MNIAKTSPVALVTVLPSVYAMLPLDKKKEMSWTKDEVIDSAGFEMEDLNVEWVVQFLFKEEQWAINIRKYIVYMNCCNISIMFRNVLIKPLVPKNLFKIRHHASFRRATGQLLHL